MSDAPERIWMHQAELCHVLIQFIETDHDYGCECSACRAIAAYREHAKVALEATTTQEETDG